MRTFVTHLGFAIGLTLLAPSAWADDPIMSYDELSGTYWLTTEPFQWVKVSPDGQIATFETDNSVLYILENNGPAFAIKFNWWSEDLDANVFEYGVMVAAGPNSFAYQELNNANDADFPAWSGGGMLTIVDEQTLTFYQTGHGSDGSSIAFSATMGRVDEPPTAPQMARTFPEGG